MNHRKKLIEVALPLEAINKASAREKSIRHGHPSTLHLWWARRPLAACRAVIFASLVDDPGHHPEDTDSDQIRTQMAQTYGADEKEKISDNQRESASPTAPPAFIEACRQLPKGKNAEGLDEKGRSNDTPRMRLFDFIERLVLWESTTDERVLETARELIRLSTAPDGPPPLLDPFAGGGSIPLEAQRLGLEAHASDLNPVAVMINKALIEIPPRFANQSPVNPRDRAGTAGSGGWKGAAGLAADVRYYGEWMRDKAYERIGHLYPDYMPDSGRRSTQMNADKDKKEKISENQRESASQSTGETIIAWLWARTVRCPNPACGATMPLVRSFWLSKKKGRKAWVVPVIDHTAKTVRFTVKSGKGQPPDPPKVSRGVKFRCLVCEEIAPDRHIYDEGKAGRMEEQLMAIVTEGQSDRSYYAPNQMHIDVAESASPSWGPDIPINYNPRDIRTQLYGLETYADLFTPRQLTALTTFSDLVAEARQQIEQDARAAWGETPSTPPQPSPARGGSDSFPQRGEGGRGGGTDSTPLRDGGSGAKAYAEAVSVYLTFAVDKATDYWSTIATWMPRGTVGHVFARHALPMTWDYPEANPFAEFHCSWNELTKWIVMAVEVATTDAAHTGQVKQQDATDLGNRKAVSISTDPPYYDNIGYADLSDYFYAWLRPSLRSVYPDVFGTMLVPKTPELIASPYRFDGGREAAEEHFETGLNQVFAQMRHLILPEYPLTVYYAFKQQEVVVEEGAASTGWETMLTGLIDTGFQIVGTWPMRTERSARSVGQGTNALASSIVLVCRPRPEDAPLTSRRAFVNALRRELPVALREMQSGNIAPVDLAQASIGPGMAVYSRYSQVLEPDGSPLTVRTALQLINHELDAYLAEQEGAIDADSRFAVAWFEQFGFKEGGFGQADVLARAKNTSVDGLRNAGVLEAGAGKVRLIPWEELDPEWDPASDRRLTVWEATHHLIERLNHHGEQGAAILLAKMPPDLAAEARQLAYRLYSICERKGWADHARDYNALVISWSASQEQAVQIKEQYQQSSFLE